MQSAPITPTTNEEEPLDERHSEASDKIDEFVVNDGFVSLKDFPKAVTKLLKNKVLIFNILSTIFQTLGATGFTVYLGKYLEVQFKKSSSEATILTGPASVVGNFDFSLFNSEKNRK